MPLPEMIPAGALATPPKFTKVSGAELGFIGTGLLILQVQRSKIHS